MTEEETKNYYEEVRLSGEKLTPHVMTLRNQMDLVQVAPKDIDHRRPKLRREKLDANEPVLIEIEHALYPTPQKRKEHFRAVTLRPQRLRPLTRRLPTMNPSFVAQPAASPAAMHWLGNRR